MEKLKNIPKLFKKLSQSEKLITIGAVISIISVFLPWYKDLDAWGKGAVFLGVTGPLSIIGFIILLGSGLILIQQISKMTGKQINTLKKFPNFISTIAWENTLLFVITASIYFDSSFGVNLTLKETSFGLLVCLFGSITILVGDYMKKHEPEAPSLNIFDEVEANVNRLHTDIHKKHEKINNEEYVAAKQYKEMHDKMKKNEDEKNEKPLQLDV